MLFALSPGHRSARCECMGAAGEAAPPAQAAGNEDRAPERQSPPGLRWAGCWSGTAALRVRRWSRGMRDC